MQSIENELWWVRNPKKLVLGFLELNWGRYEFLKIVSPLSQEFRDRIGDLSKMVKNVMDEGKSGENYLHESYSTLSSWSNGSGFIIFGVIEKELWIFE